MPDITLPATFTDGSALSATDFAACVSAPKTTSPSSFDVLNGQLDVNNLAVDFRVERRMLQDGEFAEAFASAFTVPRDFFSDQFPGFENDDSAGAAVEEDAIGGFLPIVGASLTRKFSWAPGAVLLAWSVFGAHDGVNATGQRAVLRLFQDGAAVSGQRRALPPEVFAGVRHPAVSQRVWSGALVLTGLARGEHSFGVRVATDAPHARLFSGVISVTALW